MGRMLEGKVSKNEFYCNEDTGTLEAVYFAQHIEAPTL